MGKFCIYCGTALTDEAAFCSSCGKPVKLVRRNPVLNKVFSFGGFSYNAGVADEINRWLQQHTNIVIRSVRAQTFMNCNLPIKWESVPSRIEIEYEEANVCNRYSYQYFKSRGLWGCSYDRVEQKRDEWLLENSDKAVVWQSLSGHQMKDGGTTQVCLIIALVMSRE